jgi:hypothetical protein
MFSGANSPLNGAAGSCAVTVWVVVAGDEPEGDTVAAERLSVCTAGLDAVLCKVRPAGDCSVWALLIEFACGVGDMDLGDVEAADVEVAFEALRDDVLGVLTGAGPVSLLEPMTDSADVLVVVESDLAATDASDSELGNAGELGCAPPVPCAIPVRGSGVVNDDELPVAVDDVDQDVVDDGEVEPVGAVDPDNELDELEERLEGLLLLVDDEPDEEDELEDDELEDELVPDGSANATP